MIPITVAKARGLGENMQNNMLTGVTRQLDPKLFRVVEVPYSATFGPIGSPDIFAASLMASVEEGVRSMEKIVREAPGLAIVMGYSFGTLVVEEFISRHPKGTPLGDKVILAPTLASARRKSMRSYGLPGFGAGIFGMPVNDSRLWCAIAWPEDVVTSLPENSILRKASPVIHWMSFQDPLKWAESLKAELPKLIFGEIGDMSNHAFDPVWWQKYFDMLVKTGMMIDGYARRGEHTARYSQLLWRDYAGRPISGLDLMARCVQNEAKKRL